ncbi:MAG TPA: hypothetical protein VNM24_06940 [Burkholderiales bacterium]|nr:hypothetical protein [Burkholderiales bacterium]
MGTVTGFLTLQRLAKGFFAVLALLAVTVALASPICDAYELPGDIHEQGCCATLNDGNPVSPAALPSGFEPPVLGPVPIAWSPEWRGIAWPARAIPPDRPPLTRPYHARSARILI